MGDQEQDPKVEEQKDQGAESPAEPDDGGGTGVEPVEGDQGEAVEQEPMRQEGATGFNPDRPVRVSPPEASQQSGVPDLEGGGNEGVEPNPEYRGYVEPTEPSDEEDEDDGEDGEEQEEEQRATA